MFNGIYGFPSEAIPWVRQNLNVAWATFFRNCDFEKHISFQYLRSASFGRKESEGTVDASRRGGGFGRSNGCLFFFLLSSSLQPRSDNYDKRARCYA